MQGATEQYIAGLERRASAFLSTEPRPFVRWAGSKRALLRKFVHLIPEEFGTYWEPFLGSGALFFLLAPASAVLSDVCTPLINTFQAVRDAPVSVLRHLEGMDIDRETYYRLRAHSPLDDSEAAAVFIYLNKTCWNGLYRVNSRGEFNVPYGRPKSAGLASYSNLVACSETLRQPGVRLLVGDFQHQVESVGEGDLVFLDPPYIRGHNGTGFVDYNEAVFRWEDQERLAVAAVAAAERGATVLISNADHPDVHSLFRGFRFYRLTRSSTIASDARFRALVSEGLFYHSPD